MAATWEYLSLIQKRHPMDDWAITISVTGPGGVDEDDIRGVRLVDVMNRLGSDGWEVIGPPHVSNLISAEEVPLPSGPAPLDSVMWLMRQFWFKRPVEGRA